MIKKLPLNLKESIVSLLSKKWSVLSVIILSLFEVSAQVRDYTFSQHIGTYSALINGTEIAQSDGTSQFDGENWTIPITFVFPFNGTNYSTINVNSNGYLSLGGALGRNEISPISSASTNVSGTISALALDLIANTTTGTLGKVTSYESIEPLENNPTQDLSVLTIEFTNWTFYNSTSTNKPNINFQFKLYSNGTIKIIYGAFTPVGNYVNPVMAQIGLRGADNLDFNNRTNTDTTSFTSSIAGTVRGDVQRLSFTTPNNLPTLGLTYTWIAPTCFNPPNLAIRNVLANGFTVEGTSNSTTLFDYEIRTNGQPGDDQGVVASGTAVPLPLIIDNISSNTSYSVFVRSNCLTETAAWSSTPIRTLCGVYDLPFLEGFNSTQAPACWTNTVISGTTGISFVATSNLPNATVAEGTQMLKHNYGNNRQERFTSPEISTTGINTVLTEFDFFHSSIGTSTADSMILEFSTNNGITWTRVDGIRRANGTDGWSRKRFVLPSEAGNTPSLLIGLRFKSLSGYNMYVDGFEVKEVPSPYYSSITGNMVCSSENSIIRITGENLTNATVTVNNATMTILNNTYTSLDFEASPGTMGTITVTTPNGSFTINELLDLLQPPTLTLNATTTSICASTDVTINIASPINDFENYQWLPSTNGIISGNATSGYQLSATESTNFILEGTLQIGEVTCTNRDTFVYLVVPAPIVNTNFSELTLCEEQIQVLSFTSTQAAVSADNPNPFRTNFRGVKTQTIILASELQSMGITPVNGITSITINAQRLADRTYSGFRIQIGNTTGNSISNTFVDNLTTVYQSDYTLLDGTNTFTLEQPFFWDGVSNIIIETAFRNNNFITLNSPLAHQITTEHLSSTVFQSDNIGTIEEIYSITSPNTSAVNKRVDFQFGTQTPTSPISENTITWTGDNLFKDHTATLHYTNESLTNVYFKAGATSEQIQVRVVNPTGCVTEKTYDLTAIPIERVSITSQNCVYYEHLDRILTTSGIYIDTLTTLAGCDSIITLDLTITSSTVNYISEISCGSFNFNGTIINTSGNYTTVYESSIGCDSTVHLTLEVVSTFPTYITNIGTTLLANPSSEDILYQWINCSTNQVIPGANEREFTPTEFGTYKVRIVDGNCNGESLCVVYGTMGITYLDDLELNATPNPTNQLVTITYSGNEQLDMEIMDTSGKVVLTSIINSGSILDISGLANGMYIVQLGNTINKQTIRLIKN